MVYIKTRYSFLWLISLCSFYACSNDDATVSDEKIISNVEFIKTFGGSKNESALSVTKTQDGGYAVLGYAQSNDGDLETKTNNTYDYWLLKFDNADNLQWQTHYGGTDDDRGLSIIQTQDNGFALLGYSKSSNGDVSQNSGFEDFWITKLNATGDIIWEKSFGFAGTDKGISLLPTNDNGFLLTGVLDVSASGGQGAGKSLSSKQHAGGDYWVIKLDASGEKQWCKFFGGSFTDTAYGAIQDKNNAYVIVGSSDSNDVDISKNKGAYDFWVVKLSQTGTLIWEKSFGGSETDEARGVTLSADGQYVIVGDTRSQSGDVSKNNGAADIWVIKISTEGNIIWEKTFGGRHFDVGRSIRNTQDNGFIISGSSRSADGDVTINQGQNDAWIVKLNNNGIMQWQKTIGGSDIDFAYDAVELDDETIIAVGESSSNDLDSTDNKGFSDLLILKLKNE